MAEAAADRYPVQTSFAKPERWSLGRGLLRLLILFLLVFLANGLFWWLYLSGPVVSAVLVGRRGGEDVPRNLR